MRGVIHSVVAVLVLAGLALPAGAQRLDPAKWTLAVEPAAAAPGGTVLAKLTAKLEPGWHLYSLSTPRPSIPTTIKLVDPALAGKVTLYQPPFKKFTDPNGIDTETYEDSVTFLAEIALNPDLKAGKADMALEARYSVCDDKRCLPPVKRQAAAPLTIDLAARPAAVAIPAGYATPQPPAVKAAPAPAPRAMDQDLAQFLLIAFGFGLAAIFTPCVFPMIPITMSFFLNKQSGTRGAAIFQAATFCLGIIVLFSAIGLILTTALGPFAVVQLGSNIWVNLFISAIFFVFGLSLLGAFEITLPSGLLTRLDKASSRGGLLGTLVMGLAFSLTSFACIGPFVGPLLAAAAAGGGARPALGMVAFASGLSAPFFFLALFPSYLKRLPRSGNWMARVKVVMGFVILAAMLKYLSNVDLVLQTNFLTRERFLAAWIVLFALDGLYLLGFLRLEGISKDDPLGVGRLLFAVLFLAFAISLVPGIYGGRLGEIDAYVPLPSESAVKGAGGGESLVWMKNDLPGALDKARRENKLVFVNFTGYACTNCHWMKANMFPRPEIQAALKDFVLVELYTDGTDAASEANQKLQDSKFQTIAIPFYAILDPDQRVIASFDRLTKDPGEYLAFLQKGSGTKRA